MKPGKNSAQQAGAGAHRVWSALMWPAGALPSCACSSQRGPSPWLLGTLLLFVALSGCKHKLVWSPPSAALSPVEVDPLPDAPDQPSIASIPPVEWDPPEITEPIPRPPRRRPPPLPAPVRDSSVPQPPPVSSEAETAELAIGSLSTGGDATPQAQQQARDLIAAIQKRVTALPHSTATQQRTSLRQVTSFLKQAQQALNSGDAEGAVTLATKARLLMDDIDKK